jgi:hypothetical protein
MALAFTKKLYLKMNQKSRENYLRVTQVLYPFSGLDKIPQHIVDNAARRGTKVHKICEGIMEGIGEHGVDQEVEGYVESFKQWWGEGRDLIAMEKRFWCDEYQITGQVDMIILDEEGAMSIVDIKTSSKPSKTWELQGNAYAYLAKSAGYEIKKVKFLHLNKFGLEPKIYEYPIDELFFLSILRIFNHFWG